MTVHSAASFHCRDKVRPRCFLLAPRPAIITDRLMLRRIVDMLFAGLTVGDIAETMQADERSIDAFHTR